MTEQLTPELKAAFEAIMKEYDWSDREKTLPDTFCALMLKAYNLDKWVDVKTPPKRAMHCTCISFGNVIPAWYSKSDNTFWVNENMIKPTKWQPLPAAPLPSHTITKGEGGGGGL